MALTKPFRVWVEHCLVVALAKPFRVWVCALSSLLLSLEHLRSLQFNARLGSSGPITSYARSRYRPNRLAAATIQLNVDGSSTTKHREDERSFLEESINSSQLDHDRVGAVS